MNPRELWDRYQQHLCRTPSVGLRIDVSRMKFEESMASDVAGSMASALDAMGSLERGERVNVSENRMVGHYWLRAPDLAPDDTIRGEIADTIDAIKNFAGRVHGGEITPQRGDGFYVVLVVGIGGSSLGGQVLCDALGTSDDPVIVRFLDNTDPDGIDRILDDLDDAIAQTLTIVVSKSGGTIETRNAMLAVARRYRDVELDFAKHAVAITCDDSELHQLAIKESWLATFPMWDWVGGRTSVTSAAGLLPAALAGVDIDAFLEGSRACDEATRSRNVHENPAAMLAMTWHDAATRRGLRRMVVMPYRDRLALFTRYLQQLVMESLGKKHDRDGTEVHEGLTVYGNKGTSDQHALVQQLREGPNDFFAVFLGVNRDRATEVPSKTVEGDVTCGDYLHAFRIATRDALYETGRESITITLDTLDARSLGTLIALFERAVGLYAELVNVNAYDQPGVEAGKREAMAIVELQRKVFAHLRECKPATETPEQIAEAISDPASNDPAGIERIHAILEHAAANGEHGIMRVEGDGVFNARYGAAEV